MIEKIIEFSAKNRFLVLILTAMAVLGAVYCVRNIPLDAIPDLSDTQVIVYSRWDRSPDIIEDQVTYPIVTAMLGAPHVKAVRGFSDFGYSFVYIIFDDGTDIYWARSRTLEYLNKVSGKLPEGVRTEIGPDATSVGWVYQYALVDKTGQNDLGSMRGFQDWYLRYWLQSVQGVAEVASVGGFQKQYQVNVDPAALTSYNISINKVVEAVRNSNEDVGARLVEFAGTEFMVRGRGYIRSIEDIENTAIGADALDRPVLVKQVARVVTGPDLRRGVADLDGQGDTVGGIVMMRSGENALQVIDRVKAKIEEIKPSLPPGVEIVTTYDRSDLIKRAIATLQHQLIEEMIIVSLVIMFFLWHFPSASVPIVTIPIAVLLSFIPLFGMKLTTNIMSLSGIAISIGVLVDGAIIEVENAYKKLQLWDAGGRKGNYHDVLLESLKEVGPSVFFSLLVIAVAFLPIFTLLDQEGRLFRPLAFSKNFAMAIAAILAITLNPAMRMLFTRMDPVHFHPRWIAGLFNNITIGKYYPEEKHPVSRTLFRIYEPVCRFSIRHWKATLLASALLVAVTVPVFFRLGSEFMPPLNEGTILYMPTTVPGISVGEAQALLQTMDKVIMTVPEVDRVFGKAGRAETSTDPAPLSMFETTIILKPLTAWRKGMSYEGVVAELDQKMQFPGVSNAWTMPIKARIDMLSTGVRTPVGIKIYGKDLKEIERIGFDIEKIVKTVPGARSVYAERVTGGYFLDFDIKRDAIARYGLSVKDVEETILSAIGGETVTTTIEGPERYAVNVRYLREFRNDVESLNRVLVATPLGTQVPLGFLADLRFVQGPAMIRNENGMRAGYVYVDVAGRDIGSFVEDAKRAVNKELVFTPGYAVQWSGQYENMMRVEERLKVVIPITLMLIFLLLYMNVRSGIKAGIVMLAVPFSLVGAVWFLYLLDYNLLFLDLAYVDALKRGKMQTRADLEDAIVHGAVKRIRPKLMTVMAMFMGLIPIMWSFGAGADIMKRIAAPMIGGIFSSFVLELLVYPAVYFIWKWYLEMKRGAVDVGVAYSGKTG